VARVTATAIMMAMAQRMLTHRQKLRNHNRSTQA
jgi:hypothetical protein